MARHLREQPDGVTSANPLPLAEAPTAVHYAHGDGCPPPQTPAATPTPPSRGVMGLARLPRSTSAVVEANMPTTGALAWPAA